MLKMTKQLRVIAQWVKKVAIGVGLERTLCRDIGEGIGRQTPDKDANARNVVASTPNSDVSHISRMNKAIERRSQTVKRLLKTQIDQAIIWTRGIHMLRCCNEFEI